MNYRLVADGLAFPEGPLELPNGDILVTEIRAGVLTRITPQGEKSLFATTGGGPNGAALGPDGYVFVAQNGGFSWSEREFQGQVLVMPGHQPDDYIGGQIQKVSPDGSEVTTIYTECDGERLKGPNDLVFDAEGNFYFTDHGKNRTRDRDNTGVFYASPDGKMIKEIIFPMQAPNGLCLSPDGKVLYVCETPTARVWAYPLVGPGQVGDGYVLATVPGAPPRNLAMLDSCCIDGLGNVLVATLVHGGVTTVTPLGETSHLAVDDLLTTNCMFAGPDLSTLYVTASTTGRLVAFDNWPTPGHKLNFQA